MITAENFLQDSIIISHFYHDDFKQMCCLSKDMQKAMIEFAKLHVAEALNTAYSTGEYWLPGIEEIKEDILSSYPLKNIK